MPVPAPAAAEALRKTASTPWTDLALTLPIFVVYHLGVVWLPQRNAADWVTFQLVRLAEQDLWAYAGLTLSIALVYVGLLVLAGRGQALHWGRFVWLFTEAVTYAVAMRLVASYVVGRVLMAAMPEMGLIPTAIMSLGAGFYEEIAFRVVLFGLGFKLVKLLFTGAGALKRLLLGMAWALLCSLVFSGWHHVGEMADPFDLRIFLFRTVCGLVFTLIYTFRGFAPAVWTHALYDLWVLLL
ncbi:MAG TPA: CPBP family intramembrane glutamate endopeptidase [Polyangiaceae bacterium]|nr:CPBP family intramembrane glutamate endopeptidase [Polyangiaceae bacterium]